VSRIVFDLAETRFESDIRIRYRDRYRYRTSANGIKFFDPDPDSESDSDSDIGHGDGDGHGDGGGLLLQNANVRQVPIRLAIVEAIADHEEVLDLGAEERDVNLDFAP